MNSRAALATLGGALLLIIAVGGSMSAAQLDVETRNKQAVHAAFDNWRKGTGGVFDLLAPDARRVA